MLNAYQISISIIFYSINNPLWWKQSRRHSWYWNEEHWEWHNKCFVGAAAFYIAWKLRASIPAIMASAMARVAKLPMLQIKYILPFHAVATAARNFQWSWSYFHINYGIFCAASYTASARHYWRISLYLLFLLRWALLAAPAWHRTARSVSIIFCHLTCAAASESSICSATTAIYLSFSVVTLRMLKYGRGCDIADISCAGWKW